MDEGVWRGQLDRVARLARIGVWRWRLSDHTVEGTARYFQMLGLAPQAEPVALTAVYAMVHPDDRQRVSAVGERVIATGVNEVSEFRVILPDGAVRVMWSNGEYERDADGRPVAIVGVLQDVTEQRRAEAEGERLRAHLAAAQRLETVGTLAGGVAHDFNNLLVSILGHADLALDSLDPGHPARSGVLEIRHTGERAAGLTRQLLACGRQQVLRPEPLCLDDLVAPLVQLLRRLLPDGVTLTCRTGASAERVRADRTQLEQVVLNLVVNARDAIEGQGTIVLRTGREGDELVLSVDDTGCGMSAEVQERVFEPFFTTKPPGKGTGLGLAVVYGIVRQHQGRVLLTSHPGEGTRVEVRLPLSAVGEGREGGEGGEGAEPTPGQPQRVLVVEDDEVVRRIATTILGQAGYQVCAACDGQDALEVLSRAEAAVDLVLTDLVMPRLNGAQLLEELRERAPGARLLLTSGHDPDASAAQRAGVEFLQKPYGRQELLGAVRRALD